jgi:hypothetical protein
MVFGIGRRQERREERREERAGHRPRSSRNRTPALRHPLLAVGLSRCLAKKVIIRSTGVQFGLLLLPTTPASVCEVSDKLREYTQRD